MGGMAYDPSASKSKGHAQKDMAVGGEYNAQTGAPCHPRGFLPLPSSIYDLRQISFPPSPRRITPAVVNLKEYKKIIIEKLDPIIITFRNVNSKTNI